MAGKQRNLKIVQNIIIQAENMLSVPQNAMDFEGNISNHFTPAASSTAISGGSSIDNLVPNRGNPIETFVKNALPPTGTTDKQVPHKSPSKQRRRNATLLTVPSIIDSETSKSTERTGNKDVAQGRGAKKSRKRYYPPESELMELIEDPKSSSATNTVELNDEIRHIRYNIKIPRPVDQLIEENLKRFDLLPRQVKDAFLLCYQKMEQAEDELLTFLEHYRTNLDHV